MAWRTVTLMAIVLVACIELRSARCGEISDLQGQLRVLSKQVTILLDRRRQDLVVIEDNVRNKLNFTQDLKDEILKLRQELDQLRASRSLCEEAHNTQEKNEHATIKWLSNTVNELKVELGEIQATINSTIVLQNHEQVDTDLSLMKSDVSNINRQFETVTSENVKNDAALRVIREELASLKDQNRAVATVCGQTKNQLKATQMEWTNNWKVVSDLKLILESPDYLTNSDRIRPSRHQKLLRKHVIQIEKNSKMLFRETKFLKSKLLTLEEETQTLRQYVRSTNFEGKYDRINGNEIQNQIELNNIREVPEAVAKKEFVALGLLQDVNTRAIANLTKQLNNFDKLHISMLELLENVESIENKVDNNFPDFRKEISKVEIQVAEAKSELSSMKEDQTNLRNSVKAIGVSVSNMQDRSGLEWKLLEETSRDVQNLMKSSNVQTTKLHDHISKTESTGIDSNSTKSTIVLVQELKSFEKEYQNIVNKLPQDCSTVAGPNGIYLISPGNGEPILAYCKEGWTTIQKRDDGSVNFNQNWNEYSNGFGSVTGEHWLGNRNIHYLTKNNCSKLQINMKDIYGKYWEANYDDFRVSDYNFGFKLIVNGYKGNASDALNYQNEMEFSTIDNDRDISNTHCARNYEGGWWFSHCQHANLNGRYNLGLTWFDSSRNEWIAVSKSEMRVKSREKC